MMFEAEFMRPMRDERYEKVVRELFLADPAIKKLIIKVDSDPKLVGAGVIFLDKHKYAVPIRKFSPSCRTQPLHLLLHEVPPAERTVDYAVKLRNNQRESRIVSEAVGALLSCSAAILGWVVVAGSAGAVPLSGGTSAAVTVLTYSAATASSVQCLASGLRLGSEIEGRGIVTDWLDSQEWYSEVMRALDIISLAGVSSAGLSTFKAYQVAGKASSRSMSEILKGMTRTERKRLTQEIIRVNHPGISNGALKAMIRSGVYPKIFRRQAINTALMLHVKDAVGASFSFTGSAVSGVLNEVVVGVYEELL